ncbi:MAG TPA: hypothetical protein PLM79_16935 [Syntrophobacteraceae bacterium]|nr:hypothetical protein [Syntrophobacteraceae bacterium]
MIICACDPDCRTPAFALFDGTRLMKWKLLDTGRTGHIDRVLPDIQAIIDAWRPGLLVIENQYLPTGPEAAKRFKPVSQLVAARGMITAIFAISNIEYRLIEPFAWQKTLGGAGLGRDQLKRRSILKATDIAGALIEDHNVADAINIGYFYATRNRLTRKASECVR